MVHQEAVEWPSPVAHSSSTHDDVRSSPPESAGGAHVEKWTNYQKQSELTNLDDTPAAAPRPIKQSPPRKWWQWGKTAEEKVLSNLNHQFSGNRGWNGGFYYKPRKPDQEHQDHTVLGDADYGGSVRKNDEGKFEYRNQFGQKSSKYSDVAVYLSPTNYVPKRLVVQSTDHVLQNRLGTGDWRRKKMSGDVPTSLQMSEWALAPFAKKSWWHKVNGSLRLLVVCIPLQLYLAWPGTDSWADENTVDMYTDFPGYHWQWAKHAINPLDQTPQPGQMLVGPKLPSSRQRLIRPRQMVVQQDDGSWKVDPNAPPGLSYVFISYADKAFSSPEGRLLIQKMAANAAHEAGCRAYWLDFMCRAEHAGDLLDSDVYRMCDVIRGCSRVVVMLPSKRVESKKTWGERMWTLPEALLAPGHRCFFSTPEDEGRAPVELSLIQMTSEVWDDPIDSELDGGSTRLLAEHFAGLLTLSRLELFSTAVDALATKSLNSYKFFTPNDVTYAVMGLLHYRVERDDTDSEFQSLAQLSLRNDGDRIVERMVSLYPYPTPGSFKPFRTLARADLFSTHLWDIEPTCEVVGVAHEDNTVLLDGCRAMHIRWKGFPRPAVVRDLGFQRFLAAIFVTAGTWWFVQGVGLAVIYTPSLATVDASHEVIQIIKWMVAGFLFVSVLLSVTGPFAVRRLHGGQVLQSTSNLVAFEGVMPIAKLERLVFGNDNSRLSYDASSTPINGHYRHPSLRIGFEPDWVRDERPDLIEPELPKGHRLFTLVDTGELSVSIFHAERPPTVALLCGREGGMMRAVLCSWQFENDCLYKEAVVRMPSNIYEAAAPKGWLKLCLGSMNQERDVERAVRLERAEKAKTAVA